MSEPTDFLDLFYGEANERLDNMVSRLLEIERGDPKGDAIEVLFREAHTIKGAAGMLGLSRVQDLAHLLEDLLAEVREAGSLDPRLAPTLLHSVDILRAEIAGETQDSNELVDELNELRQTLGSVEVGSTERPVPSQPQHAERRPIRVPAEKIDRLLDLVGETALHRSRLDHALSGIDKHSSIIDELDLGDRLLDELKDAAVGMRTLPLASIVAVFPRAIRDLALAAGKEVHLELEGIETELDRTILESLPELLTHLMRNAIAHGIEDPDERVRKGKARQGSIVLSAMQRGSEVEIMVRDDGAGVSEEIFAEARSVGSLTEVLTRSGYSTAESVTELAGRGVGLDAVRSMVEGFGGRMEIRSETGAGTSVILLLPLALALLEVLLVERAACVYAIALSAVEEVLSIKAPLSLVGHDSIELRGQSVAVVDLADVLNANAPSLNYPAPGAVVLTGDRRVTLACDHLLGQEEIVVKSLGLLKTVRGYVGGAILGDGRVALLLDLGAITRSAERRSASVVQVVADQHESAPRSHKVLVVEDFFTARELQRHILESAGYQVVTAENGSVALEILESDPDIALVISDVEMPVVDGFELTETIRRSPSYGTLPVIIVTTRDTPADRQRGLDAGADAYMIKRGFDQRTLLETVKRFIGI